MATMPKRVRQRISTGIKTFQKVFRAAHDRDINESDTVVIITDFLSAALGFDKYTEITTEFAIRGTYCDLAVKIGGKVEFLIEVKAIGVTLRAKHLRQAIGYASQHGVEWVVLTNGATWRLYRLRFERPIETDLIFSCDLLNASPSDEEVLERFFTLSKEGLAKSAIEDFSQEKAALSPFLISAVLQSPPVLSVLRRELRRISPGARVDAGDLCDVLQEDVLKREVVEGEDARAAATRAKKASSRRMRKVTKKDARLLSSSPKSEDALPE